MPYLSPHCARRRSIFSASSRKILPVIAAGMFAALAAPSFLPPPVAAPSKQTPAYAPGFPLLFPRPVDVRPREGALVVADIDGDGSDDLIASIPAGLVTAVGRTGVLSGWPRRFNTLPQPAYPVGRPGIGDLDGDGRPEIVTCVSSGVPPQRRTWMFALRADGSDLLGWPLEVPVEYSTASCTPAATLLADLDSDGRSEVFRAAGLGEVWGFDGSGSVLPGWPFVAAADSYGRRRSLNADPIAVDLDGDGRREILVVESGLAPRLMAIDALGHLIDGFPLTLQEVVNRQAPTAYDLDQDGRAEITQATLPFSGDEIGEGFVTSLEAPEPAPIIPAALHALRSDGSEPPGWPIPLGGAMQWGAMLADLDGDGRPEILQGDGDELHALDAAGQPVQGFPISVHRAFQRTQDEQLSQWLLADLDADGLPEFIQARGNVYLGETALRFLALRRTGQPVQGFPFTLDGLLTASQPVALDLTGDGRPELAILANEGTYGAWRLLAWDLTARGHGRLTRPSATRSAITATPRTPVTPTTPTGPIPNTVAPSVLHDRR